MSSVNKDKCSHFDCKAPARMQGQCMGHYATDKQDAMLTDISITECVTCDRPLNPGNKDARCKICRIKGWYDAK